MNKYLHKTLAILLTLAMLASMGGVSALANEVAETPMGEETRRAAPAVVVTPAQAEAPARTDSVRSSSAGQSKAPEARLMAVTTAEDAEASITRDGVTTYYDTFQSAIDAARIAGDTVEVLRDATAGSVKEGKKITVHIPQGVTVSDPDHYGLAVSGNAEVTVTGSGTIEGVGSTGGVYILTGGKVTLDGVSVSGTTYGAYVNNGTLKLVSGQITGSAQTGIFSQTGTLELSGGKVSGVDYGLDIRGGTVALSGTAEVEAQWYGISLQNLTETDASTAAHFEMTGGTVRATQDVGQAICGNNVGSQGTSIQITGGTFSSDVSDYLAEGVKQSYTGTVVDGAEETPLFTDVAAIGNVGYATLQAAIDAAQAGDTVVMLKDTRENVTVAQGQNITLDLNGKTLNGGTAPSTAALTNLGTVTITDSAEPQEDGTPSGTIMREDVGATGTYYTVVNRGVMTIAGGYITNNSGEGTKGASLVINLNNDNNIFGRNEGVEMTITGGKLYQEKFIALKTDPNTKLTITGGEIISGTSATNFYGDVTVQGGTVKFGGRVLVLSHVNTKDETHDEYAGNFAIQGGTVICDGDVCVWNGWSGGQTTAAPALTITGGDVTLNGGILRQVQDPETKAGVDVAEGQGASIQITGGTFNTDVADFCADDYLPLQNAEGKFVVTEHGDDHHWDETITTPATCTTAGEKTLTCTICGETEEEAIDPLGHDMGDVADSAADPTCTVAGKEADKACSRCDHTETGAQRAATGHASVTDAAVAATCAATGLTEGSHCSVCGVVLTAQETVPALGHTMTATVAKLPTCTQTGNNAYWTCSACEKVFRDAAGETETTVEAETLAIDPDAHTPGATEIENTVVATCATASSRDDVVYCAECGAELNRTTVPGVMNPNNHVGGTEVRNDLAATCQAEGYTGDTYCLDCETRLSAGQTVARLPHTVVTDEAVAATYTATGLTEGSHCSVCNAVLVAQEVVPMLTRPSSSGGSSRPSAATTPVPTEPPVEEDLEDTDVPLAEKPFLFEDVALTDWYYEAVKYVFDNELMKGVTDTSFAPAMGLDRAMVVTMLYRVDQEPEVTADALFADVAADQWYTAAVAWGVPAGVVKGYDNGAFGPQDMVTREQLALFLFRYAQLKGHDVTGRAALTDFSDAAASDWALEAVEWAVSAGLIQGNNGQLNAGDGATRAEAAAMFARFAKTFTPAPGEQ